MPQIYCRTLRFGTGDKQLEPVNGSGAEEVVEMEGLAWDIGWVGARMGGGGGGGSTVGSTEEGYKSKSFWILSVCPLPFLCLSVCLFPHHNKNQLLDRLD